MRLLSAGARVFKWGVPRVWLADMDFPVRRCACTLRVMWGGLCGGSHWFPLGRWESAGVGTLRLCVE
jgi:hypothetical protein